MVKLELKNRGNMTKTGFTAEQIATQSMHNLNNYILLTIAYFKDRDEPIENWLDFLGQKFVQEWAITDIDLREIAGGIVLNNLSAGAEVVSLSGSDSKVEIILKGWPADDALASSGVSWAEAQSIHNVLSPVFTNLGLKYVWQLDGKQVKIELSR